VKQRVVRVLWVLLGWFFVGLGIVGVALPVMPTTPFLLLAAGCFAKGSPRLHNWLMSHPTYGPILTDWYDYRAIPRRARWLAVTMITISFTFTGVYVAPNNYARAGLVLTGVVVIWILYRFPSREEVRAQRDQL